MAIKAKISKVIYQKESNSGSCFYILKLAELDETFTEENGVAPAAIAYSGKTKTAVLLGNFETTLKENQCLKVEVETTTSTNKKNGETQFQLKLIKLLEFSYDEFNKETIIEYLKKSFQGLPNRMAISIIGKFGKDTMDNLGNVKALMSIPGITEEKAKTIATQHLANKEFITVMKAFENIGIDGPVTLSANVIQRYGKENAMNVLVNEPFRLYEDGICDFKMAESIATRRSNASQIILGYDRIEYIRATILNVFEELENSGHCCISDWNLFNIVRQKMKKSLIAYANVLKAKIDVRTNEQFAQDEDEKKFSLVIMCVKNLVETGVLKKELFVVDGNKMNFLYRTEVYEAEVFAAKQIMKLCNPERDVDAVNIDPMDIVRQMEADFGMKYADCQVEAICALFETNFLIVTGGPGTGKTTTLKGVIEAQVRVNPNLKILCAAPTGRASQRMAEATGYDAKTVHRLLEVDPTDGLLNFKHNLSNPLDADLLVIDEFSMVDIVLFGHLMRAITPKTKVVFVGDSNQLPSVGPGSVLRDIIESKKAPCVELEVVFRQDSTSLIAMNANFIKFNQIEKIQQKPDGNFFCLFTPDNEAIKRKTIDLFKTNLNKYKDIYQVQILCPVKKDSYLLGCAALNPILRDIANPRAEKKQEYRNSQGKTIFREGDKIMQKKNNYTKDCYNGDLGIIQKIDNTCKEILVKFQFKEEIVSYDFSELAEIELAYATTIHKSQGSEYKCVICPISPDYNGAGFNSKNLLYTGLTRAKDVFYFTGDKDAIMFGLKNVETTNRCTTLRQRIEHLFVVTNY